MYPPIEIFPALRWLPRGLLGALRLLWSLHSFETRGPSHQVSQPKPGYLIDRLHKLVVHIGVLSPI